jgi:hypothetical protein
MYLRALKINPTSHLFADIGGVRDEQNEGNAHAWPP